MVAHSFASGEAVRYVTRHSASRVSRLLLLASAAITFLRKTEDNPLGTEKAVADQVRAAMTHDFPGGGGGLFRARHFAADRRLDHPDDEGNSLLAAAMLSEIQMNTDFRPELAGITTPHAVRPQRPRCIGPGRDHRPAAAALTAGALLKTYEGPPHGLYFTHQDRLNADIANFACAGG
ncbi:MAG: TAP-like family protein [Rhodospirillales bacterium]|nr:TAP-like family protein [Rhodospirillales bacterium]